MSTVYAYIRFSTPKQEHGDSRERQEAALRSYCARNDWTDVIEFGDYGRSAWAGTHLSKGELGKFAARVRAGEIARNSILLVEDLDRLSRQEARVTQRWLEDMTDLGLRIAVVNGKIYDQASLKASIFETFEILMKAQVAWEYSQRLSGRLKSSWVGRRKEAANLVIVSAHAPGWLETIGERGDPNRHFKEIPERVAVVQNIYRMAAEGMGARSIATKLNEMGAKPFGRGHHHEKSDKPGWEHTYVGDILRSAAVEGDYQPGMGRKSYKNPTGERIVGYFPRVVDADLVARARAAVASRKGKGGRGKGSEKLENLFAGLFRCGECDGRMRLVGSSAKPARYLVCQTAHTGRGCNQRQTFNYRNFEQAALDAMLPLALDDRFFQRPDVSNALAIQLAEINKSIEAKKAAARNLGQAIAAKPSDTLAGLLGEAENDLRKLQSQRYEMQEAINKARGAVSASEHANRVLEVRGSLHHPDKETRLAARRKVIQAVASVVDEVRCILDASGERMIHLMMIATGHCVVFDNKGNKKLEFTPAPDATPDSVLGEGRINTPVNQERVAAYLRRRAAG